MRTVAALLLPFVCGILANADDLPPGVADTQNPNDVSLSPQESLARITVPDGFKVTLFAGEPDLRRPIAFDFDDRGRLWVAENYSHPVWNEDGATDRILILEDSDHDGTFDRRTVFWDKGRYLTGLAFGHGGVWIANTPHLAFIPDRNGDLVPDSEPVPVLDGFQWGKNNILNNLHWGPDGWLYGAIGLNSVSFVGKPGTSHDARVTITRGIWRLHPIHHKFEVVADGMVNPWGADFNEYGDLLTTNTVTAHLWQIVPGMHCEGRAKERDNSHVYGLIQSIADHLHWGGGAWQSSRKTDQRHSVAGGGHAHCGAMIYLGDNWPEKYRGTLLTNNLHGNRVNNDRLVANKSTYVGVHADDFLFGNDPWFRGLSIKYGADGAVYVSDWHEFGECHDTDGSHRSSGRIFKVVFGQPAKRTVNLQRLTGEELAALHVHPNEWFVRRARRILHERASAGSDLAAARRKLREIFNDDSDELQQLRALWTLFVIEDYTQADLLRWLGHESQHVRRWAVRFLVDQRYPGPVALAMMARLARDDPSPKVRLALASSLQRLKLDHRWAIARALMDHHEDASDPFLPLLIWYGIEPLVVADRSAALDVLPNARIPVLRRFIARRLLDEDEPPLQRVLEVALQIDKEDVRLDVLRGTLDALDGRGTRIAPSSWRTLYRQVESSTNPTLRSVAVHLATIFGDEEAIARLRRKARDKHAAPEERRDALRALLKLSEGASVPMLHELLAEPSIVRRDAIQALASRNDESTSRLLLGGYKGLEPDERQAAVGVLSTRRSFAATLLSAIESGAVSRNDVSAFALQQLRQFKDARLDARINELWAEDSQRLEKSDEIAHYKERMTPEYLQRGDVHAGRRVFERTCSKCHTLFGEGSDLGPDLTGSGRKEIDYVLSNLVDPDALVDPAYRLTTVLTKDGRLLSGFLVQQDDTFVTLRTQEARARLAMQDVAEVLTANTSMMPEGMLRSFSDEQVRDLLLYLASPKQVALPAGNLEKE